MGKKLGQSDDPLLVSVRSGAKFSMPGMMETVLNIGLNDQSVRGPGGAGGQRALRLRLLPPADPDVRQDRAGRRGRALRGGPRRGQARQGHHQRPGPRRRRPAPAGRDVQGDRRRARRPPVPAGAARADGPRGPRRVRLVEHRAGRHLPPPGAHPRRPRHGGQHRGDGVRQPRHGLRHRRRVHPRSGRPARRASTATTCRTRRARTSSPASATPCRCRTWRSWTRSPTTSCWRTCRRSRSTTATCATSSSRSSAASCGCCRPGSASAPRPPRSGSRRSSSTRA